MDTSQGANRRTELVRAIIIEASVRLFSALQFVVLICVLNAGPVHVYGQSGRLTLEQAHVIKELLKEKALQISDLPQALTPGDIVPDAIQALPMPDEIAVKLPQFKAHRLVLTLKQILIVEPQALKVSETIDR